MKAPDKIYVKEFDEGISQMWSRVKATETTANVQHEYIRKDALIELIKEESKFWDDGKMIFRGLIEKLNSM